MGRAGNIAPHTSGGGWCGRYYPQYGDAWTCQDQCVVQERFGEGTDVDQLYIGVFDGHGKPGEGDLSSLMCKVRVWHHQPWRGGE
jgi:hypothetical protein